MFDYGIAHWTTFFAATGLLVAIPGPDLAFILGRTLRNGRLHGLAAILGMVLGASLQIALVVLGIAALVATNPALLTLIKWFGAAYLVWLGIDALRDARHSATQSKHPATRGLLDSVTRAVLINTLNPKAILFYVAFLPHFVEDGQGSEAAQLILHGGLVVACALVVYLPLVILAGLVSQKASNPSRESKVVPWANRLLGATFIALGVRLVLG